MPKKIKHESFRYSILYEAQKLKFINIKEPNLSWPEFLNNLTFKFIIMLNYYVKFIHFQKYFFHS